MKIILITAGRCYLGMPAGGEIASIRCRDPPGCASPKAAKSVFRIEAYFVRNVLRLEYVVLVAPKETVAHHGLAQQENGADHDG